MYNTDLPTRAELPTTRQLIRSTLVAFAIAGVLLTTAVMPAEYGIDPTGVGRALGLTQMGAIKASLGREAAQEPVRPAEAVAAPPQVIAAIDAAPAPKAPAGLAHEMAIKLKPGQAAEIKLDMRKGAKVAYRWTASGGVNFDTHGDPLNAPQGFYHGYGKGRQVRNDQGTLEAAFDGQHGWYWRNRSSAEVTVTLSTQGQYAAIKRVL